MLAHQRRMGMTLVCKDRGQVVLLLLIVIFFIFSRSDKNPEERGGGSSSALVIQDEYSCKQALPLEIGSAVSTRNFPRREE